MTKRFFLGITGASGAVYGYEILKALSREGEVYLAVSDGGWKMLKEEVGVGRAELERYARAVYENSEMDSPLSSGSFRLSGSVIAPSTISTASKVAHGIQDNLITRAASVALKERWPLIILLRETPLSTVALRSLLYLSEAGAVVMPASPGFYHSPKEISDLVLFMVDRVLNHLSLPGVLKPYGEG